MKEWKEELDYKELKNRRRTLGNIRFIGELFKLKVGLDSISIHVLSLFFLEINLVTTLCFFPVLDDF